MELLIKGHGEEMLKKDMGFRFGQMELLIKEIG